MNGYSENGRVDFEPEYKYITGYHGTNHVYAEDINNEKAFRISDTENNWLGRGIYFYKYYVDAAKWKGVDSSSKPTDEVIHAVIKVKYDDFVDLESREGQALFNYYRNRALRCDGLSDKKAQANQCAIINMMWDDVPELQVISGAFSPTPSSPIPTLIDTRSRRREFCVRDNNSILFFNQLGGNEV